MLQPVALPSVLVVVAGVTAGFFIGLVAALMVLPSATPDLLAAVQPPRANRGTASDRRQAGPQCKPINAKGRVPS
jgi:hypothetical protein